MSRDGSEGWAIGPGQASSGVDQSPTTTLWHFDGLTWSRCDTDGVPGVLPADPQCAELAPLGRYVNPLNGKTEPVQISVLARVPMENGADSANADDFELVAVGGIYSDSDKKQRNVVLRYRKYPNGHHWSIDTQAMKEINGWPVDDSNVTGGLVVKDVAFTAPDDGWILAQFGVKWELSHFDGQHWTNCGYTGHIDSSCESPDNRLAVPDGVSLALTTVSRRVYLYVPDSNHRQACRSVSFRPCHAVPTLRCVTPTQEPKLARRRFR